MKNAPAHTLQVTKRDINFSNKLLTISGIALATILLSHQASASDDENDTEEQGKAWHIGVVGNLSESPFIGGEKRLSLSPTRLKQGGLRLNGFAWPVYQPDDFKVYLGAGLDEWNYERDDSPELEDMNELDRAINLRAGIATTLGSGWATAEIAKDLAGAHEGLQAKVRYTHGLLAGKHEIRPFAEVQWLSAELTDYYVGVDSDEVKANRPAYSADSDIAL